MSSQARVDRQRVYSAYCKVFHSKITRPRKKKAIRSAVRRHLSLSQESVSDTEISRIVPILSSLLKDGVFDSEERAREEFPELFLKLSRDQLSGKAPSRRYSSPQRLTEISRDHTKRNTSLDSRDQHDVNVISYTDSAEQQHDLIALQPLRFPFETQHQILSMAQQLLEESCFGFTKKWLPSVLKIRGWNCAAAVELTKWLDVLQKQMKNLPDHCMGAAERASFKEIYPSVARLRHSAVHRLHLGIDEFSDQILCARTLAEILQDVESTSKLQTLYLQVHASATKMKHATKAMKQEVHTSLSEIQKQRKALIQKEQQLHSSIAGKQADISVAAGLVLVESIDALFALHERNSETQSPSGARGSGNGRCFDDAMIINEDDIESDEDQLQAELGK